MMTFVGGSAVIEVLVYPLRDGGWAARATSGSDTVTTERRWSEVDASIAAVTALRDLWDERGRQLVLADLRRLRQASPTLEPSAASSPHSDTPQAVQGDESSTPSTATK